MDLHYFYTNHFQLSLCSSWPPKQFVSSFTNYTWDTALFAISANCYLWFVLDSIATPQPTEKYCVYVVPSMAPTGGLKLLSNEMTLAEVSSQFWRSSKPLELFYEQQ